MRLTPSAALPRSGKVTEHAPITGQYSLTPQHRSLDSQHSRFAFKKNGTVTGYVEESLIPTRRV